MPWNPEVYNQFKTERHAPFADAIQLIDPRPDMQVVDLGCGSGELTRRLADALPGAEVLGIDSSAAMLEHSRAFAGDKLRFEQHDIGEWLGGTGQYDLIFSNAALQWLPDHETLFAALLNRLRPGGQLVVQMPLQHRNMANRILYALAAAPPFHEGAHGFEARLSVLESETYAELLFRAGGRNIVAMEKVYPVIVPDVAGVYDFINGTALRPFLAALDPQLHLEFRRQYLERLREAFPQEPVFYPFKRMLLAATF